MRYTFAFYMLSYKVNYRNTYIVQNPRVAIVMLAMTLN